jgi:hypothetical protein
MWSVRHSDVEDSGFESHDSKSDFFMGRDRNVNIFLLLPNDTSAPCLSAEGKEIIQSIR